MAALEPIMAVIFDFRQRIIVPCEMAARRHSVARPKSWGVFVVLVGIVISLGSNFPAYVDAATKYPGNLVGFGHTPLGRAIIWWLDHPLQPVPVADFFPPSRADQPLLEGSASHCDKLTFRAFIPLLNQVTGGGIWTLLLANYLAAILTFFLIYRICFRVTSDAVLATAATWAYAACWAGAWGFNDMVCGDAVGVALLVVAMAAGPRWVMAPLVLAAGLTDERALCAAPLIALFRCWERRPRLAEKNLSTAGPDWKSETIPVLAGIVAYLLVRLYGAHVLKLPSGTSMIGTFDIVLYHFYVSYPAKIFGVYEFLWIYPVLLLFGAGTVGNAGWRSRLVCSLCLLAAAAPAFVVWDVDRSLCYLLPGILLAICFSPGEARQKSRQACAIFLASLFWLAPNVSVFRYFVF